MAWTSPRTWVSGAALAAAELNVDVRDNADYLKDVLDLHGLTSATVLQDVKSALFGVRAVRAASQSISDAIATSINFNEADEFDSDAFHDTVTNNVRLTVPSGGGGYYLVGGGGDFVANATGQRNMYIEVNGSGGAGTTIAGSALRVASAGGSVVTRLHVVAFYQMAAADYFALTVYQNSTGALGIDALAFWCVRIMAV